jgi:inhibitor of cysteine peptidase
VAIQNSYFDSQVSAFPTGEVGSNSSEDGEHHDSSSGFKKAIRVLLLVTLLIVVLVAFYYRFPQESGKGPLGRVGGDFKMAKFSSDEEFNEYLKKSRETSSFFGAELFSLEADDVVGAPSVGMGRGSTGLSETSVDRISQTNVQVGGIDEPDILKNNASTIFFSPSRSGRVDTFFREPLIMPGISIEEDRLIAPLPPELQRVETKVIKAFPPSEVNKISGINRTGEMLLDGNNLIIFSGNEIVGFDVSDTANPAERWKYAFDNSKTSSQLVTSRLKDGKIYLVTSTYISGNPCPMPVFEGQMSVSCTDIYYPVEIVSTDSTFTVLRIDPASGEIEDRVSFVGSANSTVVYMSNNSIYITYTYSKSYADIFSGFIFEKGRGVLPDELLVRFATIQGYDISDSSKFQEFFVALERYYSGLGADEKKQIENELENRMKEYGEEYAREFESTGIVKVSLSGLDISESGTVPGKPLNQFALDEYNGDLRIATTVGHSFGLSESFSDVYVLNDKLRIRGSVEGLGLTERIFAVRFMADKGYVVTFRQIDPFYTLDLSEPDNPRMVGELKIPGFSAYLHPLDENKILGVGREGANVKLSLFDVSDFANPIEVDNYVVKEFSSEVLNNHRAFLLDARHKLFFVPAGGSGYVFSYEGDRFELKKVVGEINVQRALFINDYLYVVGNEIVVINESDMTEVNRISIQ